MKKSISKEIFVPFGIEIEMEGIDFEKGKFEICHNVDKNWKMGTDSTLIREGIELSSPVLSNEQETFEKLKKLAKKLETLNVTFQNASFQVNLDADSFRCIDFVNLLKMFSIYENIIYQFSMGEDQNIRESAYEYAAPIGQRFYDKYHSHAQIKDSYQRFINNKAMSISLKRTPKKVDDPIKIIEFRTPNGTYSYDLWFNYITFFSAFLTYVKNKNFDKEKIDYLFEQKNFLTCMQTLEKIDEKKAIQLAELIFTNEEDKSSFYKQYVYRK